MKLNWSRHKVDGFEDAFEHTEIPWPCKVLDADGNECLIKVDETCRASPTDKLRPDGMALVRGVRLDTDTGEVWYMCEQDNGEGHAVYHSKVFKAPLKLVKL